MDILAPNAPKPQAIYIGCTEDDPDTAPGEVLAKRLKVPFHMGKTEEAIFEAGLTWLCQG